MSMSINTNVVSINAQRNLGLSGNSLAASMQRLSSGLRVNSAKDDAAGLAISERMNAQMKGLKVAARNANDGISLAQTAEGALGKVGDMLQRARELAVQSSNATNSTADRKALQAEVNQLLSEVDRVAKTTSFNGRKILDGSFSGGVFQVGAGAGDNITVGALQNTKVAELSNVTYGASTSDSAKSTDVTAYANKIDAGALGIRVGTGAVVTLGEIKEASSGQERMGQVVAAINAKTADTGVTAFLEQNADGSYQMQVRSDSEDTVSLQGFSVASTGFGAKVTVGLSTANATLHTNAKGDVTGLTGQASVATWVDSGTGAITLPTASGGAFADIGLFNVAGVLSDTTAKATMEAGLAAFKDALTGLVKNTAAPGVTPVYAIENNAANDAAIVKARDALLGAVDLAAWQQGQTARDAVYTALDTVLTTTTTANVTALNGASATTGLQAAGAAAGYVTVTIPASPTDEQLKEIRNSIISQVDAYMSGKLGIQTSEVDVQKGLDKLSIETQAGAWEAIQRLDSAIDQVNAARGDLGALQTRFEKTVENIDIQNENISAARGRIVDADFASETANLSRAQILQQAGTAMVAQANQLPQQVLSLLR